MICRALNPLGRLNAFQRVMLQWSELHPYNAIHTYRLAGPLHLLSLRRAIQDAFEHNGLGIAEIDPDGVCYRHEIDNSIDLPEVEVIADDQSPEDCLTAHLSWELNRPFGRPRCRPFRFTAVDAGPQSHYVSLVYDHWAADSVGARLLMRHVLGRYLRLDLPENEDRLDLCPGTYRNVLRTDCKAAAWLGRCCDRLVAGWETVRRGGWLTAPFARWTSQLPVIRRGQEPSNISANLRETTAHPSTTSFWRRWAGRWPPSCPSGAGERKPARSPWERSSIHVPTPTKT